MLVRLVIDGHTRPALSQLAALGRRYLIEPSRRRLGSGRGRVRRGSFGCGPGGGEQLPQGLAQALAGIHRFSAQLTIALQFVQPATDLIHGIQQQIHVIGIECMLAVADLAEHILGGMHYLNQRRHLEQARRPFQGMHGTKKLIERVSILALLLQGQTEAGDLFEQLAGFA